MRGTTAGSRSGSPVRFSTNTVIGTPQARWRLMHQSGPGGDHGADAVAALVGDELRLVDGAQRVFADALRPVHADEPLRRGAEDQRRLGAPGMRVGMHQLAAGQQRAGLGQRGADRVGGLVDVHAGEQRHPGIERAVVADRLRDFQVVAAAEVEVLLAVAGGDVDEAGAGLGGDEVAEQQRRVLLVAAAAQRVGADRAVQRAALVDVVDVVGGDADVLAELRQQRQGDQQLLADPGERARPPRRQRAPARSRSPCRRRRRGCRAWSRGWWSRSPPRRRPVLRQPARALPGSAPRSSCWCGRDTRSRLRPARSSPPATT